jgi:hypothetical protein
LFGASGTYQEGYVTSCLQQSATKITADSARTNDEYSHLKFSFTCLFATERRAADFDVSVLVHSHSPASRLTLGA